MLLVSVKESLRSIPNKGVGYGILNHLGDGFAASPEYSIVFNYLGDFGSKAGSSESVFDYSNEYIGSEEYGAHIHRCVLLNISSYE